MANQEQTDVEAIKGAVRAINEHWQLKQYDRIGDFLAAEAVVAPPGLAHRIRGRGAYAQSYRDYDQAATTLEFSAGEPDVDVIGDVAVAVCPFHIVYEVQGARHDERGHDILVFSRSSGKWLVVWRTMLVEPVDGER
jgi:ketosteroid isomerase-like protein